MAVSSGAEESNRRMLRVRDTMDRTYAQPLDIALLARIACLSPTHLIRTFRATFGETPHRYLQRRRVERAMYLLRATDRSVTDGALSRLPYVHALSEETLSASAAMYAGFVA